MYFELIDIFESGLILFISRLLTEDPHQRLGAGGASEVNLVCISSFYFQPVHIHAFIAFYLDNKCRTCDPGEAAYIL